MTPLQRGEWATASGSPAPSASSDGGPMRKRHLATLLKSLFSKNELRRFVAFNVSSIEDDVNFACARWPTWRSTW